MKAKTIDPNPPVRSIADILKEADSVKDLDAIIALWNEIANNKYRYSLDELHLANRQFRKLVLLANASQFEQGKFYMYLLNMGDD